MIKCQTIFFQTIWFYSLRDIAKLGFLPDIITPHGYSEYFFQAKYFSRESLSYTI